MSQYKYGDVVKRREIATLQRGMVLMILKSMRNTTYCHNDYTCIVLYHPSKEKIGNIGNFRVGPDWYENA